MGTSTQRCIDELYIKVCPNAGKFLLKLLMSTILTICALFLYLGVVSMNAIQQNYYISYNDSKIGNYSVYYINQWGKVNRSDSKKNPLPIGLVIIGDTRTKTCKNFQDCSKILKSYLEYEISSLGYADVCENFFIADDGTIYVGGGWDIRNCYDRLSIEISFIGNFNHNNMTRDMIDSFLLLLDQGVTQYKLPRDYVIVAINQTIDTFSPGKNVYNVIKQMCHFSNMNLKPKLWKDFLFSFLSYINSFFKNIFSGKNICLESASLK